MEIKVGQRFAYNQHTLEVVEAKDCRGCFLKATHCELFWRETEQQCSSYKREDMKKVKFVKVD